jgi:hypothetical protein
VSHSFFSADRSTHFKIVAIAIVCSVGVTLCCLLVRTSDPTNQRIAAPLVIKAKASIVVTSDEAKATR